MSGLNYKYFPCRQIAVGFVLSPLVPFLPFFVLLVLTGWMPRGADIVLITLGLYLPAIVFGVPAFIFLEKKRVFSLRGYLLSGFLVGAVCSGILMAVLLGSVQFPFLVLKGYLSFFIFVVVYAVATSYVFWRLVIKPRIEKSVI